MFARISARARNRRSWRLDTAVSTAIVLMTSVVSPSPATAAGPVGGHSTVPPSYQGPLACTGLQAWQLIWLGIGLLIAGVVLLILVGRRRPRAGDVR